MPAAPADLARWTPVALSFAKGAPALDWADLRGVRFAEPFFQQTVERWAGANPAPLVRTGYEALAAYDGEPSLDPDAIIFHVSRCGSTLLSRLLGTVPGVLVVAEPPPVNEVLLAEDAVLAEEPAILLRRLVRALGRKRLGDERHYVLKLSSWNVCRFALFRSAFPKARLLWLQREPEKVLASLLADPPGWFALARDAAIARRLFGIDAARPDAAAFALGVIAALFEAASRLAPYACVIDYAQLPGAAWGEAASAIGLALRPDDIARMAEEARYTAKEPGRRPFAAAQNRLPPEIATRAAALLDPLYEAAGVRTAALRDLPHPACL
jgi:hypothetical protein